MLIVKPILIADAEKKKETKHSRGISLVFYAIPHRMQIIKNKRCFPVN